MTTETFRSDDQAAHAALFDEKAREVIGKAIKFASAASPALSGWDCARMYLAASVWLAAPAVDRAGTVAMLRQLADEIEARRPVAN